MCISAIQAGICTWEQGRRGVGGQLQVLQCTLHKGELRVRNCHSLGRIQVIDGLNEDLLEDVPDARPTG